MMLIRFRLWLPFVLTLIAVPTLADAVAPRVSVDAPQGRHRLWVELPDAEGRSTRLLVRESEARIEPGTSGSDPSGTALYLTWTEDGTQRWSAYSRDGGVNWSTPRPTPNELRLLRAPVPPGAAAPQPSPSLLLPPDGRLHLLQFKTTSLPEWREPVEKLGVEFVRFFPDNAHLVRIDPSVVDSVEQLGFVERVAPYHPAYRLDPELIDWLEGDGDPEELRVNVMTLDRGAEPKSRLAAAAQASGARIAQWYPSGYVLELWVTRDQLRRLASDEEFAWADRWSPPEQDMDLVRVDSGADWIESVEGYCGQGVRGEVMDWGVQADHRDFDGILLHGPTGVDSHGTCTYGIVFGNGDRDGDGDPMATGHLPCAEQGIFGSYADLTDRFAYTQELKDAPYYASFQSNSWGATRTRYYNSYSAEMDDIIFQLDIAITQSQSNAGNQLSRPEAWAKNVISVGGIQHMNTLDVADDAWGYTASIGPAWDGRVKPDVSYWNDYIYTTDASTVPGGDYTPYFNGTSASTPEVAGVVGLMVQMWSENVWGTNPTGSTVFERQPHFGTIKALLINNAQQWEFSGTDHDLTRTHQGWGRPSAKVALERAANSFVVDQDQPLMLGQTASYALTVRSDETELKVTMVFPDPPALPSAEIHRINDVNLRVTSPSGLVYLGNVGLDGGLYSTPGSSIPNSIDTVENVFVPYPEAGVWTVDVEAAEINADGYLETPGDDVVFALVVTGAGSGGQCGNGIREAGEDCDGDDRGGRTCRGLGCDPGGALACNQDCTFDTSQCTACPACGDGNCDVGETCVTCPADCVSESAQQCGNGLCETADGEDCETCSLDCRGELSGSPSGRFCCGSSGEYGVDCTDARCSDTYTTCVDFVSLAYCCGDTVCEGAEDEVSCAADCAVVAATPGEAGDPGGQMLLAEYDDATGIIALTYGDGCEATDHVIQYGDLTQASIAAYSWSGQVCGLGMGGAYAWTPPASPESLFFVIVGNNGTVEGSYGLDGSGAERPEDVLGAVCPLPQDLTNRCD
jgi:hypothetical protein